MLQFLIYYLKIFAAEKVDFHFVEKSMIKYSEKKITLHIIIEFCHNILLQRYF